MVLIAAAVLAGYLAGRYWSGRARHFGTPTLRYRSVIAGGVAAAVAANRIDGVLGLTLLLTGLGMLAIAAATNLHFAGAGILAAGVVMNVAVIGANGGMPVHPPALVSAGITSDVSETVSLRGHRRLEKGDDYLVALDDRIPLRPIRAVVSVGDLVIALGLALVVAGTTRPSGRPRTVTPVLDLRENVAPDAPHPRARAAVPKPAIPKPLADVPRRMAELVLAGGEQGESTAEW
jgi:hypothetical protein